MFNPSEYDSEHSTSGVYRASREVETPISENSDSSGRTTASNNMYYYRNGDEYFKVSKVGDNGWTVWRYATDPEEGVIALRRHGSDLNAQTAHRIALRRAVERSS
jgi:hypothetical protein